MKPPRQATAADAVLGVVPRLVFEPATTAEAVEAVQACAKDKLKVVVVGGGTDLGLGNPPSALDAVIRTGKLTRVLEHAPHDQIVRVEAGLTVAALQAKVAPARQRLALDPPFADRATAGGVLCGNAFGPLRASRGSTRDLVIGLTVVRADGVVAHGGGKVVKNVAGFDLPRVFFGSHGTLGLVTEVHFRLHPLPEAATTLQFAGLTPARVRQVVKLALAAQVEPAAAAAVTGRAGLDLAVRFEGFGPGVAGQVERLLAATSKEGIAGEKLGDGVAAAFWARHDAVRGVGPLRLRLSAPPAALEQAAAAMDVLLAALPNGAGAWYPTLGLGFVGGPPASPEKAAAAVGQARAILAALGGAAVINEAPLEVRKLLDAWGPPPGSLPLMRRLKEQLDPDGRLAPGRFVGGI